MDTTFKKKIFLKNVLLAGNMFFILYSFCTRNTISDIDGNIYRTVKIGNQIWTVENLRTTKFNDGTSIPHVLDSNLWHSLSSPGYCYYRHTKNVDTIQKNGALYNWHCIGSNKLAPQGWHVPTNDDWNTLKKYLIAHGYNWDRTKSENRIAKSLAAQHSWKEYQIEGAPGNNIKKNNRSGFSGLAAGYRYDTWDVVDTSAPWKATFSAIGEMGFWWSATPVNKSIGTVYGLSFCVDNLMQYQSFYKTCGYSVRLVKNRE